MHLGEACIFFRPLLTPLKRGEIFLEICLLATPSLWREGWEGSFGEGFEEALHT